MNTKQISIMKDLQNDTITKELIGILIFSFLVSLGLVLGFFMLL